MDRRLTPILGGPLKSEVINYLELAEVIYTDATARCPADASDLRDLLTIRSRVEHEGLSFLTITLPNFCKGVETALEQGGVDPLWRSSHFRGFPFRGAIPAFLSGMLNHVFDIETGRIYDEQDPVIARDLATFLASIRQICLAFKKVEVSCTPARESAAISGFIETERFLSESSVPTSDRDYFLRVSDVLWHNLVYRFRDTELLPRHGPGATAERISGNQKYVWRSWYQRLDNYFPLYNNAYLLSAIGSEDAELVTLVPRELELPVRVTPVPKTLKGPRIIAIEPVCMQYAQQGIRSVIYDAIESYWMTQGHINFRDQTVNQSLAMKSSATGRLATIDLSDASDRVPRDLALEMFRSYPDFMGAVDACRSTSALLPGGTILSPLSKFASMGSALCFPVESMYFYTICVAALLRWHDLPVSPVNCFLVSRDVYVYGDDILVPADAAVTVIEYLHKYFCKPNTSKTFWNGNFRESCGVDAFRGVLVTPIYIRKQRPRNRRHAAELTSWSATANLFFKRGYLRTAEFMHSVCERILGNYPEVPEKSAALGRTYRIATSSSAKRRVSPRYQHLEVKVWVACAVYRTDELNGYGALQKSLLRLEGVMPSPSGVSMEELSDGDFSKLADPFDPLHLERSALHGAVTLQLRWVRAH